MPDNSPKWNCQNPIEILYVEHLTSFFCYSDWSRENSVVLKPDFFSFHELDATFQFLNNFQLVTPYSTPEISGCPS